MNRQEVPHVLKSGRKLRWKKRIQRVIFVLVLLGVSVAFLLNTPYFSMYVLNFLNEQPVVVDKIASQSQAGQLSSALHPLSGVPKWVGDTVNLNIEHEAFQAEPTAPPDSEDIQKIINQSTPLFGANDTEVMPEDLFPEYNNSGDLPFPVQSPVSTANADPKSQPHLKNSPQPPTEKKSSTPTEKNPPVEIAEKLPELPDLHWLALPKPQVIVVLGGGLTYSKNSKRIVINSYTRNRLMTAVAWHKKTHLPLLLSGVEAPYMQEWLLTQGVSALYKEGHSMNTCENARFTALLLQKYGGSPSVYVVTDAFHMSRAIRLFAGNGILVKPVVAELPVYTSTGWFDRNQNIRSRRAFYEILAYFRDVTFDQSSNCREVP